MKRSTLLLGFAVAVTLPSIAFAEIKMLIPQSLQPIPVTTNPLSLPANSQYLTLENKFSSAKALSIEELKGSYSGRCFFKDSPSKAVATLLVADTDSSSSSSGPAFRGAEYRHVTPLVETNGAADAFDTLDSNKRSKVDRLLATSRELNAYPVRSNGELVVAGHRTEKLQSRVYRIRKSGKFNVLKLECAEPSYCSNLAHGKNHFLAYEGEALAYCYYFQRVK